MKKRILSVIIMSALVLSLTACGTSTDAPEATEGTEVTTTAAAEEEKTEAVTEAPAETEETTTEAPKEVPKITKYNEFSNSCLAFDVDGKGYVYNLADNKMYEIDTKKYKTEYIIAKGKIAISNDILFNLETGEVIADKKENGIEIIGKSYNTNSTGLGLHDTNYIPVMKIEESFNGNATCFGIVDTNGEWVLPLSSEYEICNSLWIKNNSKNDFYCSTGSLMNLCMDFDTSIYDFKNDKIIPLSDLVIDLNYNDYRSVAYSVSGDNIWLREDGYDYSNNFLYFTNPAKYDPITGELTKLYDGGIFNYLSYVDTESGACLFLDDDYNVLDYDLSKYFENNPKEIYGIQDYNEHIIIANVLNPQKDLYTIILSTDGSMVIEPIKGAGGRITGDYAVLTDGVGSSYIINYKTGETKKYTDDVLKIVDCDSETGKLLVLSDGAYYIADVSDPETLINPFEIAE